MAVLWLYTSVVLTSFICRKHPPPISRTTATRWTFLKIFYFFYFPNFYFFLFREFSFFCYIFFVVFLVLFFALLSFVILFIVSLWVEMGLFMVVVVCLCVPKLNQYAFLSLKSVFKRLLGIG